MSEALREIPAANAVTEIEVLNSRFIANLAAVDSVAAAKAFIASIRAAMPDASHHVYAYVIGHGGTTTLGMSDDGEPSGTAGRPVLAVLRGSGLGDAVLVVTRYFGGTLLGTGGLVHAYGDAAKAVLALTPRTAKIAKVTVLVTLPYPAYETARRLILAHAGQLDDEQFAADVTLTITLPEAQHAALSAALREATAGQAEMIMA
jgi:uncharacterized YigZ family protein